MDFGGALSLLKAGRRVARRGWNGKGMWLALSPGADAHPVEQLWSLPARAGLVAAGQAHVQVRPYIVMYTVDGALVAWTASQTDLLADDWGVL